MLNRFNRDVLPVSPDYYVIVLGGSNDIGCTLPFSGIFNNLKKLYEKLRKNNIEPIACTLPSIIYFDTHIARAIKSRKELNELIKKYCSKHEIICIDLIHVTADNTTNRLHRDYSNDSLHLTMKGYRKMADAIYNNGVKKILILALDRK